MNGKVILINPVRYREVGEDHLYHDMVAGKPYGLSCEVRDYCYYWVYVYILRGDLCKSNYFINCNYIFVIYRRNELCDFQRITFSPLLFYSFEIIKSWR